MEPVNYAFFELLKFPVSELYLLRSGDISLQHRGSLQLLYSDRANIFLLKLGTLKFALDKSLQIIGAFSDAEKYPAYLMPTFDGFYLIKILDGSPSIALTNFETILSNTCVFRTKSGLEQKLGDIREMTLHTKLAVLRETVHMTKDAIVKTLTPTPEHPNYTLLRTFEDLQKVNSQSVPVVDVTPDELEKAKTEVDEVVRNHQSNKYWNYFSEYGCNSPSNMQMDFTKFRTEGAMDQQDVPIKPKEPERKLERADTQGCDNIDTKEVPSATEQQEIVGTENQRLPSYEVQHSKEHVEEGLDMASCRLEDAKFYQSCDLPPIQDTETQLPEDANLTTGLLRPIGAGKISEGPGEGLPNKDGVLDSLEARTGDLYRIDFTKESEVQVNSVVPEIGRWGSNVSNPSETTAKFSDAGLSTTSESVNDFLGEKPLIISGNLNRSQNLSEKPLGASPTKENLGFKQNLSEKQNLKQKNISDQGFQKENVTAI